MFPRISTNRISGRSASNIACRRGLVVATLAPEGSICSPQCSSQTKASRASTLDGIAASVNRSSNVVGKSFSECTARSIRPAMSASSISLMKMPFASRGVPSSYVAGALNPASCIRSPTVRMTSISTVWPFARSLSATWFACHSASCEPLDPTRIVCVVTVNRIPVPPPRNSAHSDPSSRYHGERGNGGSIRCVLGCGPLR